MRRREFIALAGGAAAYPLAARAQRGAMPVVGILATAPPEANAGRLHAFYAGLEALGFVDGQNVKIEYRWAEEDSGQLPEIAAELAHRPVSVLVSAGGTAAALVAKAATSSVPIVFGIAGDPVSVGLVKTLNQPGGNITGVTSLNLEVTPKKIQILHDLLPSLTKIALLVNPTVPDLAESAVRDSEAAAATKGLDLHVLRASGERDFEDCFAAMNDMKVEALAIAPDNVFTAHSEELAALALRHAIPAVYQFHRFVAAGGLMSYGSSETEYYNLVGNYTGRVLKGEKPVDLPVQQSTVVQLAINLKTAKALGITVPVSLLGRADEVIE